MIIIKDGEEGWWGAGGVFAQVASYLRLFRQQCLLHLIRQRQVVLTWSDENVPLAPNSDGLTLSATREAHTVSRPSVLCLPGQQDICSRKPRLAGKSSAKAGLPTQSRRGLGDAFLLGHFFLDWRP